MAVEENTQKLFIELLALHRKGKSAQISVHYEEHCNSKGAITITVREGEIAKILPAMELTVFFSSDYRILKVKMIPTDALREINTHTIAPKLKVILADYHAHLKAVESAERKEVARTGGMALAMHVEKLITPRLEGENTRKIISAIAYKYSPNKYPVEYLEQCRKLVTTSLNDEIANGIFLPLIVAYQDNKPPASVLALLEQDEPTQMHSKIILAK
jgi:hypothetical protein